MRMYRSFSLFLLVFFLFFDNNRIALFIEQSHTINFLQFDIYISCFDKHLSKVYFKCLGIENLYVEIENPISIFMVIENVSVCGHS